MNRERCLLIDEFWGFYVGHLDWELGGYTLIMENLDGGFVTRYNTGIGVSKLRG